MADLTRLAIYPQERLQLSDLKLVEASAQLDWTYFLSGFLSQNPYILQGFEITNYSSAFSAVGIQLQQSDVVLFNSQPTSQATGFYAASGTEANATLTLQSSVINYVECNLTIVTGSPDNRVFLDPTANNDEGAEYTDEVDTVIYLQLAVSSNASGFTANSIPLYEIETDFRGVATSITDCRNLLFRLGTGGTSPNPENTFPWPALPASQYARNEPPSTATSGDPAPFQGGDKNIKSMKQFFDAIMSAILEIKGTAYWYSLASGSINGLFAVVNSWITPSDTADLPQWSWDGANLSITDDNVSPALADVLVKIRVFGSDSELDLERADGQAGTSKIAIGADQVLFIEFPSTQTNVNRNYSGNGSAATNYQVVNRSAFTQSDSNYWIAYRTAGTTLVIRGGVKLESGESDDIDEGVLNNLLENLGLTSEKATPNYSSGTYGVANGDIRGGASEPLVTRLGNLSSDIGDEQEDRSAQLYSTATVTWSGTALSFGSNILIDVFNSKSGTAYTNTILTSNSPITLADGDFVYATLTRGSNVNVTLVLNSVTPIPAQTQSTKDIIVLFKRIGSNLLIPLHKQLLTAGQVVLLGTTPGASGDRAYPNFFLSPLGAGDGTTFTAALAALPTSGGVILLVDSIVLSSVISLPANVKVMARDKNASIEFATGGSIEFTGLNVILQDLYFTNSGGATGLTYIQAFYDRFLIHNCNFSTAKSSDGQTYIDATAPDGVINDCTFSGILSGGTNTAINEGAGSTGLVTSNPTFTD